MVRRVIPVTVDETPRVITTQVRAPSGPVFTEATLNALTASLNADAAAAGSVASLSAMNPSLAAVPGVTAGGVASLSALAPNLQAAASIVGDDTTTLEDFEDESLSAWNGDIGSSPNFRLTDGANVPQGSWAVHAGPTGQSLTMYSTEGDGLPEYPGPGSTISCLVYLVGSETNANLLYGFDNTNDYYQFQLSPRNGNFRIGVRENGDFTELDSDNTSPSTDTLYEMVVDWGADGSHTLRVYQVNEADLSRSSQLGGDLTAQDSTHTATGVGFINGGGSNGEALYDYLRTGVEL